MKATSVDDVVGLYARWGENAYDEDVTQLAHALQTAALARRSGADDVLVAAALLHDVGHLLDMADGVVDPEREDLRHEARGAAWLGGLFPPSVTQPIARHVRAKRYIVAVDPEYATCLSRGSVASLARQGGPLTPSEVAAFERSAGYADAVSLRRWDDAGKVEGLEVAPLSAYRDLLATLTR